jgi:hypothetical protein
MSSHRDACRVRAALIAAPIGVRFGIFDGSQIVIAR